MQPVIHVRNTSNARDEQDHHDERNSQELTFLPVHGISHYSFNLSWIDFTRTSLPCRAVQAATAAWAAEIVVMQVTPRATAAERIFRSSKRLMRPLGVL